MRTVNNKPCQAGVQQPGRVLGAVTPALSALQHSYALQQQAATVGFDWAEAAGVYSKLQEEMAELAEALEQGPEPAREELGDVLFVCVALARHLGCDPEALMQAANHKFERRFNAVEARLGGRLPEASLAEMEAAWQAVKRDEVNR